MKQITSFLLMMLFMGSTVFAQTTSTGLAKKGNDPAQEAFKLEQVALQSPFSLAKTLTATPSPNQTDDDVIRYDDGVNADAIGLTQGGTFELSAYWPASTMGQYAGMKLSQIEIYINDVPTSAAIKIYDAGTATVPGALLHEQTLTVTGLSWNVIELSSPVDISGDDIWIGYEVTHDVGVYAPGCDAGPAVAGFGDMISLDGTTFEPMSALGLNYNWNIAATLIEGTQYTNDVGVQAINQPVTGPDLGDAEPVMFTIKNFGTVSQSNIAWEISWNGPTGADMASGTFAGPLASGATASIDAGTADLSTYGSYTFEACTQLTGDENPGNDCKTKAVTNSLPVYCDASTTFEDEFISNVLCGTIDNSSGWQGGVADYTDQMTSIASGQSEDILVTNGNPWSSDLVTVWVDWNMNYELEQGGDEEFILTDNGGAASFSGAIEVPAGTPNGQYRMRIRMSYSTAPVPCGVMSYGEVEDYTIMVGDPPDADVGVSAVNMAGFYEPGVVSPKATVKNYGANAQSFDVTMTIGSYTSTKTVSNLAPAGTEQVTFDNWNATVGSFTAQACTELAGDENPANDCKSKGITVAEGNFVYAYNAYDPSGALVEGPVTFDIINPGMIQLLAPTTSADFIAGACWAEDTWYGVMYGGGLYTIDTESGEMTFIGNSPDCSGLAYDGTTLYGASITDLYSIDMNTGAGTLIGAMGNAGEVMIGIGCNAAGDLFGVDLGDDVLYSIDKATGAATAVGPLGIDLNYAQDMAFDKVNDICYLAAYTSTGGLYSVDYTTGATTSLGEFAGGAEITGFAIPGASAPPAGPPPENFAAVYTEDVGVNCTWEEPIPEGHWIGYDNGVNNDGLGFDGGGTFWGAIHFDADDLTEYDGQYMTKFEFFPRYFANESDFTFKIWEGANAANLVYEEVVTGITWNQANVITMAQAYLIDASVELWFGFEVTNVASEWPFGYDSGPAVAGYGDMVSLDGTTWQSMSSEWGLDYNFNLQGFVAEATDAMVGSKEIIAQNTIIQTGKVVAGNLKPAANPYCNIANRSVSGYNVYRDNVKLNTDIILDLIYFDANTTPGTYVYTAKAVYPDGLSDATPGVIIEILAPEIAVSPTSVDEVHTNAPEVTTKILTITNNGTDELTWEVQTPEAIAPVFDPEAERILNERIAADPRMNLEADKSPIEARRIENSTDEIWDVLYTFSAQAPSCQAVATDGNNFYMTYWNGAGLFDKFDMDGNYISSFTISSAAAIRDFAFDGTYFYGAPGGGMSIARLDLANQTLVSTISISSSAGVTGSRHLSYDPELDNGNGGFWLGQWGELAAVDMTGATIYSNSQTPAVESCYGSAYDPYSSPGAPKLWLFTQNAGGSPNDLVMLEEFDINTRTFTGYTFDLFSISGDIPGYIPGTAADQTIAGGAVAYADANGKYVLAANIQQSPNLVVGLELGDTGPGLDNDVLISAIVSPSTGMALGVEDVIVNVKNQGENTQSNIPFEVHVDGALFYSGTVAGPLAKGEFETVNCGTIDLSEELGEWLFEACTMMAGDENPDNDCKSKVVIHEEPVYCDASTTNQDEFISNVLCGTINNASGWQGGVADYTDISTVINAGESEDIVVTNGNAWTADKVTCWVDWNMNYEFDVGTDEQFVLTNVGGAGESFEGAIAVPANVPNGEYRMRIRMSYSTDPVPCGAMSYGEVEDYTIAVGGQPQPDWYVFEITSGVVPAGGSQEVPVTFNSTGLENGLYEDVVTIVSNAFNAPELEVPVSLEVTEDIDLDPPTNLVASVSGTDVNLTWTSPSGGSFNPEWIGYSNGPITNSIGTDGPADFGVAARFTPADLTEFEGGAVTKLNFVPGEDAATCTYTLQVWQGAGNPTLIYSQELATVVADDWNEVVLDTPVPFDNTEELWVGFNCNTTDGFPAGCDDGPQDEGLGNMMYWEGAWTTLTALAPTLTFNWAVEAYVEAAGVDVKLTPVVQTTPAAITHGGTLSSRIEKMTPAAIFAPQADTRALTGFNVYRNGVVIAEDLVVTEYTDEDLASGTYAYYVTAVYDEGESDPSNTETVTIDNGTVVTLAQMDFEPFADWAQEFDPWLNIDVDGQNTYGFTGYTFPGSGTPMAYLAFNPASTEPSMSGDDQIQPHGGERFGAVMASVPGASGNNDWLISPQILLGTNSLLNMYVKSYTAEYGLERYNIGVSTGSALPDDFTIISGSPYLEAPATWTNEIFDLSAYDGQLVYVGIQCVSNDAFVFMVDDILITSVVGLNELPATVAEFTIYPNPAKNFVNISSSVELKSVKVINLTGQVVYNRVSNGTELQINTSNMAEGMYVIQLETTAGVSVQKLIIE